MCPLGGKHYPALFFFFNTKINHSKLPETFSFILDSAMNTLSFMSNDERIQNQPGEKDRERNAFDVQNQADYIFMKGISVFVFD